MSDRTLPTTRDEKVEAYLRAMLEIRARFDAIDHMCGSDWPLGLRLEVSYLQLRAICDLVTVGALIVQGDFSANLGKDYTPGTIFRALEKKYPSPFPQPTVVRMTSMGAHIQANAVPDAITKNEMLSVWQKSGDRLHRLKIRKFFQSYSASYNAQELDEIRVHVRKLHALLDCHGVAMHNPKTMVLVHLYGEDNAGAVQLSLLEYGPNNTMKIVPYTANGMSDYFNS